LVLAVLGQLQLVFPEEMELYPHLALLHLMVEAVVGLEAQPPFLVVLAEGQMVMAPVGLGLEIRQVQAPHKGIMVVLAALELNPLEEVEVAVG
jgi:hypothetical protein